MVKYSQQWHHRVPRHWGGTRASIKPILILRETGNEKWDSFRHRRCRRFVEAGSRRHRIPSSRKRNRVISRRYRKKDFCLSWLQSRSVERSVLRCPDYVADSWHSLSVWPQGLNHRCRLCYWHIFHGMSWSSKEIPFPTTGSSLLCFTYLRCDMVHD